MDILSETKVQVDPYHLGHSEAEKGNSFFNKLDDLSMYPTTLNSTHQEIVLEKNFAVLFSCKSSEIQKFLSKINFAHGKIEAAYTQSCTEIYKSVSELLDEPAKSSNHSKYKYDKFGIFSNAKENLNYGSQFSTDSYVVNKLFSEFSFSSNSTKSSHLAKYKPMEIVAEILWRKSQAFNRDTYLQAKQEILDYYKSALNSASNEFWEIKNEVILFFKLRSECANFSSCILSNQFLKQFITPTLFYTYPSEEDSVSSFSTRTVAATLLSALTVIKRSFNFNFHFNEANRRNKFQRVSN